MKMFDGRDKPPKAYPNTRLRSAETQAVRSWALYSDCEQYRYRLRRIWSAESPSRVAFLMLNPSTASEIANDPTVERCERRARQMGYGGFEVVNIFAYRATNPKALYNVKDPAGQHHLQAIDDAISTNDSLICAWGAHGKLNDQGARIRDFVFARSDAVYHLGLTKHGEPRHPLYLSYDVSPEPWSIL